jgi:hypothetical protein
MIKVNKSTTTSEPVRLQLNIIQMPIRYLIIFSFSLLALSGCNHCDKYDRNYIPVDLNDAVDFLNCRLDEQTKENLRKEGENEPCYESQSYHFYQLIYRWNMSSTDNKLTEYFNKLAISDPSEMLGIIHKSLLRKLNGKEIRLANQIDSIGQYRLKYINKIKELMRDDTPSIIQTFLNIKKGDNLMITLGDNCREQHPGTHVIRKEYVENYDFCESGQCTGKVLSKSIVKESGIDNCYPDKYSVYHKVTIKVVSLQSINFFMYDKGRFIPFEHGILLCKNKDKVLKKVGVGDKFSFLLEDSGTKIFK